MSPDFRGSDDQFMRSMGQDYWNSIGFDGPRGGGGQEISMKRKYVDEERQRQQLLQFGGANVGPGPGPSGGFRGDDMRATKFMRMDERNGGRIKHSDVDQGALKKAFLHFVKVIYENGNQKKRYMDDGKQGSLRCLACQRLSKDVPDMHALVMHAYNPESADSLVDHLGFHKALCILMGWNFLMPPDISKLYQKLPADQATANKEDLILWPPLVIVHNTITGRGRDGRMEGLGNRTMDNKLRDLGVSSGKSKSLYSRDGHLGITLVKFSGDESGLKEAMRLAGHFERDGHGRRGWAQVPSSSADKDDEINPNLVKVDPRTGEKNRILYGFLATVMDMDKLDFETRKKVSVESRRDHR